MVGTPHQPTATAWEAVQSSPSQVGGVDTPAQSKKPSGRGGEAAPAEDFRLPSSKQPYLRSRIAAL